MIYTNINSFLKSIGFFVFYLFGHSIYAQINNLVPNWSFEEYYGCTDTIILISGNYYGCSDTMQYFYFNQISFDQVKDWVPKGIQRTYFPYGYNDSITNNYGTPDYFNSCNCIRYHAPDNGFGYQNAFDGNSYVGIAGAKSDTDNFSRETIRIELFEVLEANKQYCAELYWSRADSMLSICNKLGMVFTPDSEYIGANYNVPFDPTPHYFTPQVYYNGFLNDSINWNKLEGSFIAKGDEKWLTIGFLFHPSLYQQIRLYYPPGTYYNSIYYYYIDAVKVYQCDPVYEDEIILPQFLSPNGDGKNDIYFINDSLQPGSKLTIYNRWGNAVYSNDNYKNDWDGTYMGHLLPSSTYYVVLVMPKGTRKSTHVELMY